MSLLYLHKENESVKQFPMRISGPFDQKYERKDTKLGKRIILKMKGFTALCYGLQGVGLSISYAISKDGCYYSMGKDRYLKQAINRMKGGGTPIVG